MKTKYRGIFRLPAGARQKAMLRLAPRCGRTAHSARVAASPRRSSSGSSGRRHTPQGGYGHDVLGDNAGFRPVQSAGAQGVEGLVNHGPTCIDRFSSRGFVVNGISLPDAVLLLPGQSFLFAVPRIQASPAQMAHGSPLHFSGAEQPPRPRLATRAVHARLALGAAPPCRPPCTVRYRSTTPAAAAAAMPAPPSSLTPLNQCNEEQPFFPPPTTLTPPRLAVPHASVSRAALATPRAAGAPHHRLRLPDHAAARWGGGLGCASRDGARSLGHADRVLHLQLYGAGGAVGGGGALPAGVRGKARTGGTAYSLDDSRGGGLRARRGRGG